MNYEAERKQLYKKWYEWRDELADLYRTTPKTDEAQAAIDSTVHLLAVYSMYLDADDEQFLTGLYMILPKMADQIKYSMNVLRSCRDNSLLRDILNAD